MRPLPAAVVMRGGEKNRAKSEDEPVPADNKISVLSMFYRKNEGHSTVCRTHVVCSLEATPYCA